MPLSRDDRTQQWVSRFCLAAGTVLLCSWLLPTLFALLLSPAALARFQSDPVQTASWAPGRIAAYRAALRVVAPKPEAVLRLPRLGMEVPVLEGTSKLAMNLGAGHIEGTAEPGGRGNVALTSHRDGFFRKLKDVVVGDSIEVESHEGLDRYRVDSLQVVSPKDVSSLQPTGDAVLTLVTCYPFYNLGPAPKRYIVRASLISHATVQAHS